MVDYHCHLLPGIDDGAQTMEETLTMARMMSKAGYTEVYCTPHLIKNLYEADNRTVKRLVRTVQNELDREKIELKLLFGREYMIDDSFHEILNDLEPLENTQYVLVEFLTDVYQGMVRDSISAIMRKGLTPMIAHPERYRLFQEKRKVEPSSKKESFFDKWFSQPEIAQEQSIDSDCTGKELLAWLVSKHCAFQANLLSFEGTFGKRIQKTARRLKELGIYTHTGTDAHSPECLEKMFGLSASAFSAETTLAKIA